jgi:hypothetical protein
MFNLRKVSVLRMRQNFLIIYFNRKSPSFDLKKWRQTFRAAELKQSNPVVLAWIFHSARHEKVTFRSWAAVFERQNFTSVEFFKKQFYEKYYKDHDKFNDVWTTTIMRQHFL